MEILFVFLDSSRAAESFAVFTFVFEVKMEVFAKNFAGKWGAVAPRFLRLCARRCDWTTGAGYGIYGARGRAESVQTSCHDFMFLI